MSSGRDRAETDGGTQSERISSDDCFELLSNHRRRYVLHYLREHDEPATLGDLADQIAAWENEIEIDDVSYDERKRVYTSLQQVHLPRMDDMDVVEFDDREGTVEIGPTADELDVYLEGVRRRELPWSMLYLGLVGVNLVLIVAAAVGLPPLAALSGVGLAVLVAATFTVAALAHSYSTRTETWAGTDERPP